MYTYKFVNVSHSMWTGKPKESIEEIIEEFAADGWRLVQVCQDNAAMWYSGKVRSKLIFEKEVNESYYSRSHRHEPEDSFV